jgi:hypothetical protein
VFSGCLHAGLARVFFFSSFPSSLFFSLNYFSSLSFVLVLLWPGCRLDQAKKGCSFIVLGCQVAPDVEIEAGCREIKVLRRVDGVL